MNESEERFKHIELEINTCCDLDCFGCDRFSDVTTAPNMTVAQVVRFVDESLALSWEWERIRLLGGEPTLHPQFEACLGELLRYRQRFPHVFLQVLTNGHGKAAKYRDLCERHKVSLHAEAKEPGVTPPWFTNTRIVPLDRGMTGPLEPCGIFGIRGCGVGLTRHGYFLDGAGASIARVAGIDCGVMSLAEVTWERMLEQARLLCHLCGHWRDVDHPEPLALVADTGEVTGAYWTETLRKYHERKPTLRVYGEA